MRQTKLASFENLYSPMVAKYNNNSNGTIIKNTMAIKYLHCCLFILYLYRFAVNTGNVQ